MITVWTLVFFAYMGDYTSVSHEAVFLSQKECLNAGNSLMKYSKGYRISSVCYESNRIDIGGK